MPNFIPFFTLKAKQHQHNIRGNSLNVPPVKLTYGSYSVTFCATRDWSNQQNKLNPETKLPDLNGHKFKQIYKL